VKDFVALYKQLDETTSSNEKINCLKNYFLQANDKEALWCVALFMGKRFKKPVTTTQLKIWVAEKSNLPFWLVDESHHIVGDLGETIAHLAYSDCPSNDENKLLHEIISEIHDLNNKSESEKKVFVLAYWQSLQKDEIFIFNKLISGSFRVGVSEKNIIKAISLAFHIDENSVAHKLMGNWNPFETSLKALLYSNEKNYSQPFPFYLAYALENELSSLGNPKDWQAEYKWDGIRGQIIFRNNDYFVWSRGEELITHQFPEFKELIGLIPNGTVLDGEIVARKNNKTLSFQHLQKRLGRKNVSKKTLLDIPVAFIAYDILEHESNDIRQQALSYRRSLLESIIPKNNSTILISEKIEFSDWNDLESIRLNSRNKNAEGLMLKNIHSTYQVGRKKGDWWKWKVNPYTIDAVLTYAMQGHGRRANLFTDYTFAVWHNGELVTFTKAYSGLSDNEIKEVDAFVRKNTIEKFGPVRRVKPELVFEIAFEGITFSKRHKSGVALRFPRISRWRKDKPVSEANCLEDLIQLIK
jgi:DNA ligase-1